MPRQGRASWEAWSCDVVVLTRSDARLSAAAASVREVLAGVDAACSRFRDDSELVRIGPALADGAEVSPLLAQLVRSALEVADWTGGIVDPTLGLELAALGYDRDIRELHRVHPLGAVDGIGDGGASAAVTGIGVRASGGVGGSASVLDVEGAATLDVEGDGGARRPAEVPPAEVPVEIVVRRAAWRSIVVDGSTLTVPRGVRLDLGASAKAVAADLAAEAAARAAGCDALVAIGGDIATAGDSGEGWSVLVQDLDDDPAQQVTLSARGGMATSSTQKRRWVSQGRPVHHILDPRTGRPAEPVWRSTTVAAPSCLRANAFSTAAIVLGRDASAWLASRGVDARLVDASGRVVVTGHWPEPEQAPAAEPGARTRIGVTRAPEQHALTWNGARP